MKQAILMSYIALLAALALPCLFPEEAGDAPSAAVQPAMTSAVYPLPTASAPPSPSPCGPYYIRLKDGDNFIETDMQSYLVGVVAAEMPASFHSEALKAQAVAARTYAIYCKSLSKHQNADVCTDYGCCQAWISDEALRESWGECYEEKLFAIRQAIDATDGEYISYEGEAIFAAFHSSSAGRTEDSSRLWAALPYLVSVTSPENSDTVPGYVSCVCCAALDFRDTLLSAHPEADFSVPREQWIGTTSLDDSGRVETVVLGGVSVGGIELRRLFSLRSTAFALEYSDGNFIFTVTGYGHGVGMSQYGADTMAEEGADYAEILSHYYPGTEVVRLQG